VESKYYHISRGGKCSTMTTFDEALAAVKKGGYIWLIYTHPTKEELSPLIDALGLHPLAIEDCTDKNQIPKIEDYPQHTFILFNSFNYDDKILRISEVDLLMGGNFLVTVYSNDDNQSSLQDIERIIKLDSDNIRLGPSFLAHILLDQIVDLKFQATEALEDEISHVEDVLINNLASFNPAELLHHRRDLSAFRKSLFHEREVLVKIYRKDCKYISEKALLFYRDIYDHLTKLFELTESSRDTVNSLMEMYLSMLNNQMAKSANEMNATVRRLTFITTIFMPLTLLAGIGGMSEWTMMTGPANWKIAYPTFLIAMVVIGVINYYFLKWLEKKRPEIG